MIHKKLPNIDNCLPELIKIKHFCTDCVSVQSIFVLNVCFESRDLISLGMLFHVLTPKESDKPFTIIGLNKRKRKFVVSGLSGTSTVFSLTNENILWKDC